jgi:hypothetical protein
MQRRTMKINVVFHDDHFYGCSHLNIEGTVEDSAFRSQAINVIADVVRDAQAQYESANQTGVPNAKDLCDK